ncbi:negative regulator of the PHO system [Sporothrix epigloea]|uniref:Negative regulator of the PHO system n=1 Tax=Sporothrix epigloea TaxID=1892477 RepID=A0ABP0E277_9PEZI
MEGNRSPDRAEEDTEDCGKERDRLVCALQLKLAELDARVASYRRDCANEFRRYAVDLIGPLADEAKAAITESIEEPVGILAETYPALYPGFVEDGPRSAASVFSASPIRPPNSCVSPPPVLYHTSGTPSKSLQKQNTYFAAPAGAASSPSLHARDDEFRGVFTPPFLPLLDSWSNDRQPRLNNTHAAVAKERDSDAPKEEAENVAEAVVSETLESVASKSVAGTAEVSARPVVETARLEPKLKSALRRTSSNSSSRSSTRSSTPVSGTPGFATRHVRFSFNGEEVLPTATPPREQHEQDLSWLMHDNSHNRSGHGATAHSMYDYSRHYQASADTHSPRGDLHSTLRAESPSSNTVLPRSKNEELATELSAESTSAAITGQPASDLKPSNTQGGESQTAASPTTRDSFPSISQSPPPALYRRHSQILDEDEDDFKPLARKVSSSDRLRALSKMPLEDPSNWTVVNPQSDTHSSASERLTPADLVYQPSPHTPSPPPPPEVEQREYAESDTSHTNSSEDEDGFVMRASRKTKAHLTENAVPASVANDTSPNSVDRPAQKSLHTPVQITTVVPPSKNESGRKTKAAVDEDDFFGFDYDDDDINGDAVDIDVGYPLSRTTHVNILDHSDEEETSNNTDDENSDENAPVDDASLVEKEKAALGIGTDGLDSSELVFNRRINNNALEGNDVDLSSSLLTRLRKIQSDSLGDNIVQGAESFRSPPSSPSAISAGSYRGKFIDLFNVVKDPRILQQAAQMGNINSFVGSVHDRDHETHAPASLADFSSLSGREQLNLLSGTPRSLTERMAMEDARKFFSTSR